MELFTRIFTLFFKNQKKMYTIKEIEIILKNCKNNVELYTACGSIQYLLRNQELENPIGISILCDIRFRELHNLRS